MIGVEPRFQDLFQYKTESTGQEKQESTRWKNNSTSQGRIFILRTGFFFLRTDIWALTGSDGVSSLLSDYTIQQASQFLTVTNAPNKKKGLKCFFFFLFQQFPSNPARLLSLGCKRFGCSTAAFASPLPKFRPLTEGLTQAITHQVPAAVAQVSMDAAIRRQQWDGKVRNFLNTGSSKAAVLRQISAHWTAITAPTKKPLLLQSRIFQGSIKQTQRGERDHSCARRAWFMFVFKAQVALKVPKY